MAEEELEQKEETEETLEETAEEEPEEASTEETSEGEKPKKRKKIVRRRKTKKETELPLNTALRLTVESGKVDFGARSAMASLGKAKMYVLAGNAPAKIAEGVQGMAGGAGVPVLLFDGSSMELGSVCGKPYPVSVLTVHDAGSSHLLDLVKKK